MKEARGLNLCSKCGKFRRWVKDGLCVKCREVKEHISTLESENAALRAELAAAKAIITEGRKLVRLSECAGCEVSDGGRYCKAACREGAFIKQADAFIGPLPEPEE